MAFTYYRAITIDHTKCGSAGNSTDFPVLISGTYTYLKTVSNGGLVQNASGYDIGFYSDAALTTKLNWETVRYVASTGEVIYWVKVSTLLYTADTVIYMAYGDSSISTDQSAATSTWNSNFKSVYHLPDGTTLTTNDSTSNALNLSTTNSPGAVAGQVGGGMSTNGSSSYARRAVTSVFNLSGSDWTILTWVKTTQTTFGGILVIRDDAGGTSIVCLMAINRSASSGKISAYTWDYGANVFDSTGAVNDGNWHRVAIRYTASSGNCVIFIDGANQSNKNQSGSVTSTNKALTIGANWGPNPLQYFNGNVDEVQIVAAALPADWITAEYNNQNSPSTFYSVGSQVGGTTVNSGFFSFMNLIF